jgi:hypothetical protein
MSSKPLAFLRMAKRREAPRVTERHRRRQERLRQLVQREKTQKAFAHKHDLDHKHLSQMLATPGGSGWRGVGDKIVEQLEGDPKLKLPKGWFDATEVSEPLSAGLADNRPKNNVKALRLAIQSLFSVLHERHVDLAEAVAQDILETAGTEFAGQTILHILVGTLRGEQRTSEEEQTPAPRSPALRASGRAI